MCKHKSGGRRSQQTAASSSSNEAKVEPAMGTAQEYQVDGGKSLEKRNICITVVPVHHAFSPSTSLTKADQASAERESFSKLEAETSDECNETSPMLFDNNQSVNATCALLDSNKPNYLDSSEEDVLLHEGPASITAHNGLVECSKSNKKRNRWRSGVVVYPSAGSLNGEWREDVSQFNSLSNLSYDQMAGNFDNSAESVRSSHSWFLRDCQFYNFDPR